MINDKAILVGVDGSHASYKATWWAANYAKHAGLTLQIVCAYSLPSYAAVSFDATYTAMGDDNAAHSDAQEILSKAKAIADEQGVEAATLIVTGDPASVFVELSRNYNLIVIGNRGKGGLAERLLGTTSSSLPAYAYCPIVVDGTYDPENDAYTGFEEQVVIDASDAGLSEEDADKLKERVTRHIDKGCTVKHTYVQETPVRMNVTVKH